MTARQQRTSARTRAANVAVILEREHVEAITRRRRTRLTATNASIARNTPRDTMSSGAASLAVLPAQTAQTILQTQPIIQVPAPLPAKPPRKSSSDSPRKRTPKAVVVAPAEPVAAVAMPVETATVIAPPPREEEAPATPVRHGIAGISPDNTIFVSLCFEGPDVYATAGGLGARVTALTETLASVGFETHLVFVGDPVRPHRETKLEGKLHLTRWSQRISAQYPHGVYHGEDHKHFDYTDAVPRHVLETIVRPAIEQGKTVVVIGEDWHTAEAMCRLSDLLHWNGLRQKCILMWNCNSLKSLHRIDWTRLNFTTTITTVSRYMKHKLWEYGVNPLVIPNGIPSLFMEPSNPRHITDLRNAIQRGNPRHLFLFKIGRFDPDKRWLMAVEAAARLKTAGTPVTLVLRGGMEPHGSEVLSRAYQLGLSIRDIEGSPTTPEELISLLRAAPDANVYNLRFFVPPSLGRLWYASADAVLANSGHEPFGLVGLEVMASGGVVFTGSTGEDYAISFANAVALETDDPDEIVGYLEHITCHPEERAKIGTAGRATAAEYLWDEVIDNLLGRLAYLMRKQGIALV